MGYESRLYVVEGHSKTNVLVGNEKPWGEVLYVIDLCKFPRVAKVFEKVPESKYCIYDLDGNTVIEEDSYGEVLKEAPVENVIEALKDELSDAEERNTPPYRRILPTLRLLESLKKQTDRGIWEELVVIHYGY